jgi:aldehyde dehydrogenase (NAD+)
MGGKNPLIVAADADLEIAVAAAVNGAFLATGQRCTASSRLIVEEAIHDRFVARMKEKIAELTIGHSLKSGVDIGPVVSAAQLAQDLDYIGLGSAEGAELACGGRRLERDRPGYHLEPALFIDARNDMRICREEIFGPVTAVIKVREYEEAIAVANDTDFGLASGICTTSLKLATDFKRRSAAGMVMINLPTGGVDYHVPFGGRKASSYGPREQGTHAREFYMVLKTVYTQPRDCSSRSAWRDARTPREA